LTQPAAFRNYDAKRYRTFCVDIELENPAKPGVKRMLSPVLVDTGAEVSWVRTEVLESLGVERNNQWRFRQAGCVRSVCEAL
jgi:hypothetical protein